MSQHLLGRKSRHHLRRVVPEAHDSVGVEEEHAVRDVLEDPLGDRPLLLCDACPREERRKAVRDDHHAGEHQQTEREDAVSDLGRGILDGVVRREDRKAGRLRVGLRDCDVFRSPDGDRARSHADRGPRWRDRDRRGYDAVAAHGRGDLLRADEPGVLGDVLECRPVERDVGDDAADDAVARHDGDRPLHRPRAPRLPALADEELQVRVPATQPGECRMVAIPQRALHLRSRRELNGVELSVVGDSAVLAHGRTERRVETSFGPQTLVRGGVVAEGPGCGAERQDQEEERAHEPQPQPERARGVVGAVDPNRRSRLVQSGPSW